MIIRELWNSLQGNNHELRREIEANIDPEDPDPEIDMYLDEEQYEEKEPTSIAEQFLNR